MKAKKGKDTSKGSFPTLDLHGVRVDEVFDKVEAFMARNLSQQRVRIMTGKGSGKVQAEVSRYLKLANYNWSFERSGSGGENTGVLLVHMD